MYCGATAEWTVGSCESISLMPGGTVFSSVEEKDRVHLTRISDTTNMIESDSDDERKTRVHLILGSRCQQCRASVGIVVFTTGQPNRTHSSDLQEGFCVDADC